MSNAFNNPAYNPSAQLSAPRNTPIPLGRDTRDGQPTYITSNYNFQDQYNRIEEIKAQTLSTLTQINDFVDDTNRIGLISSLDSAKMSSRMAAYEAYGLSAQLEINDMSSAMNVQSDIAQMAVRSAFMLSSKAYETAILVAQFREKMLQMFITLMEQRTANTWTRIKNLTQGFKF
jgi:hypothetical protein